MIKYLAKKYIKDYKNYDNPNVRNAYGNLTSLVGIINNIVLFLIKFLAGTITKSVAISADAINNLSDAGSSIIALVSFRLSAKPADEEHPFGHARYECIASMIVACLILILGCNFMISSVQKIFNNESVIFSWLSIAMLAISIGVKIWMYLYNRKYAKLVKSSILNATAADSISDTLSTSAVLVCALISHFFKFNLDGYVGFAVALFIIKTGIDIIRNALNELLGKAPDRVVVKAMRDLIYSFDGVLGLHDMIIHDYGAHSIYASIHVEVDCHEDVLKSHDMIDNIERCVKEKMDIDLVIHMDPINTRDEVCTELRIKVNEALKKVHPDLSLHDFRMVPGSTHTNIIFDVVIPFHVEMKNNTILELMEKYVQSIDEKYYVVITFDQTYTK